MSLDLYCDCGEKMKLIDTDDRTEWKEETYECSDCHKVKIHKTWFDQIGLVMSDEVYDEVWINETV